MIKDAILGVESVLERDYARDAREHGADEQRENKDACKHRVDSHVDQEVRVSVWREGIWRFSCAIRSFEEATASVAVLATMLAIVLEV